MFKNYIAWQRTEKWNPVAYEHWNTRDDEALNEARGDVTHIMTRDERSASFMADVYARVSGRLGVCEGPSGGGATSSSSITIAVIPACFGASGSVRTVASPCVAVSANVVQIFWPLTSQPPATRVAFVCSDARRCGPIVETCRRSRTGRFQVLSHNVHL